MNLRERRNFLDTVCDRDQGSEEEQSQQQSGSDLRKRAATTTVLEEALMLDEVEWRKSEVRVKF